MAKKKRGPVKDPITFGKLVLRGASRKWWAKNECIKLARTSRGVYQCATCGYEGKKAEFQVDHIDPVVDIKVGYETMEEYCMRLFVPPEKLQLLCKPCHEIKTGLENEMRKHYRNEKKKTKKAAKKV